MIWLLASLLAFGLLFGFVVFFGPPYVPTMYRNLDIALGLLDLRPGQTVLDLGSGDGRVLIAAAKRGIHSVGIELSPALFVISWLRTRRYRKYARVIWGNYFVVKWPPADAIFTFAIPGQMTKLDTRIERWRDKKPTRLASFAFAIAGREPKTVRGGVFLYEYK